MLYDLISPVCLNLYIDDAYNTEEPCERMIATEQERVAAETLVTLGWQWDDHVRIALCRHLFNADHRRWDSDQSVMVTYASPDRIDEDGRLHVHLRLAGELSPNEVKALQDWMAGSYSDGWGECFEQKLFPASLFHLADGSTRFVAVQTWWCEIQTHLPPWSIEVVEVPS